MQHFTFLILQGQFSELIIFIYQRSIPLVRPSTDKLIVSYIHSNGLHFHWMGFRLLWLKFIEPATLKMMYPRFSIQFREPTTFKMMYLSFSIRI